MFVHKHHKRVRYAETDKMGYLYYGHYAKYYEIGRVEALRSLGVSYKSLEDEQGIMLPVLSLEARYKRSAYYDDLVEIQTILRDMPGKMICFEHILLNEAQEVLNTATVKLFFIEMATNKRVSCPEILKEKLGEFF